MTVRPSDYRPRVVLVTNCTSRMSLPVLQRLAASDRVDFQRVLFVKNASPRSRARRLLQESGWLYVLRKAKAVAHRAIRIYLRRWTGMSRNTNCLSAREYAVAHQIPHDVVHNLNSSLVVDYLNRVKTDILLVGCCSQILNRSTLSAPRIAAVNIHPSLLPMHRGPYPTFWTLIEGAEETGVTFHLMHTKIDSGDIVDQAFTPVGEETSEDRLAEKLFSLAAARVESVLCDLARGRIQPRRQNSSEGSYEGIPTHRDRDRLTRQIRARQRNSTMATPRIPVSETSD